MIPTIEPARENLLAIVETTMRDLGGALERMDWADDEIDKAMRRQPSRADTLFHSFALLRGTDKRMGTEFVFRGHCRELLDRVAAGLDTRPGTAAEICCQLCEVATVTPLTTTAVGLHVRMWTAAFPDGPDLGLKGEHYEALHGSAIDAADQLTRRKLAAPWRELGEIECCGLHHAVAVTCRYATT